MQQLGSRMNETYVALLIGVAIALLHFLVL